MAFCKQDGNEEADRAFWSILLRARAQEGAQRRDPRGPREQGQDYTGSLKPDHLDLPII